MREKKGGTYMDILDRDKEIQKEIQKTINKAVKVALARDWDLFQGKDIAVIQPYVNDLSIILTSTSDSEGRRIIEAKVIPRTIILDPIADTTGAIADSVTRPPKAITSVQGLSRLPDLTLLEVYNKDCSLKGLIVYLHAYDYDYGYDYGYDDNDDGNNNVKGTERIVRSGILSGSASAIPLEDFRFEDFYLVSLGVIHRYVEENPLKEDAFLDMNEVTRYPEKLMDGRYGEAVE